MRASYTHCVRPREKGVGGTILGAAAAGLAGAGPVGVLAVGALGRALTQEAPLSLEEAVRRVLEESHVQLVTVRRPTRFSADVLFRDKDGSFWTVDSKLDPLGQWTADSRDDALYDALIKEFGNWKAERGR
jgi:hypothetical protein